MNTFGDLYKTSIYGESHGKMVGVVIDGVPSGTKIDLDLLNSDLLRRKPSVAGETKRVEADAPVIYSGVYNGFATGAPLHIGFVNENQRSKDYSEFLDKPRPGHADFVANYKYKGYQDYNGGGHFSGRITLGLVASGSIAKMFLPFSFSTKLVQVGTLTDMSKLDSYLEEIAKSRNSVGGIIEVRVSNMIKGLGEPFFDSVESKLAHALYSIPAVKGVEFGLGFQGISVLGSDYNDMFIDEEGQTKTNNNGGINGGITNGNDIVLRVFIKPTPSVYLPQETFNFKTKEMDVLEIKGRHDACIAKRAMVVVENTVAMALADLYLINKGR